MKSFEISYSDLYSDPNLSGKLHGIIGTNSSKGFPVIFLHGRKFNSQHWVDCGVLEKTEKEGYFVIALDIPGFGKSDPCVLNPNQGEFVPKFMETFLESSVVEQQLGLKVPVVLVVPSMAGHYMWPLFESDQAWKKLVTAIAVIAPAKVPTQAHLLKSSPALPSVFAAWGENDPKTQTDREIFQDAVIKAKINVDVIIKDAHHPAYINQPEQFLVAFLDFLTRVNSIKS